MPDESCSGNGACGSGKDRTRAGRFLRSKNGRKNVTDLLQNILTNLFAVIYFESQSI